ncbi:cupin domain-containing protein [Edaphobacter bradus]|uniref:cupin domain-containing protein n=1 Tax=Edaphobacter bradus TaxID=2259016 RepID=UPI0021E07FB6|nr:cupin domain-containing protein [Edaphobacter bradus]
MHETIRVGEMSITFIKTRHETAGSLDLYEVTIPPHANVRLPHIHRKYDETVFGMNGVVTWTLDGKEIPVEPGDTLFVPRGTPHFYTNLGDTTARMMCMHTPGVLGSGFFRELSMHFNPEGPPDIAGISEVMVRYGVFPSISAHNDEYPLPKDHIGRIVV